MNQEPVRTQTEQLEFADLIQVLRSGRYLRLLSPEILDNVLRQGSDVTLKKDSYLIREGDNAPLKCIFW